MLCLGRVDSETQRVGEAGWSGMQSGGRGESWVGRNVGPEVGIGRRTTRRRGGMQGAVWAECPDLSRVADRD